MYSKRKTLTATAIVVAAVMVAASQSPAEARRYKHVAVQKHATVHKYEREASRRLSAFGEAGARISAPSRRGSAGLSIRWRRNVLGVVAAVAGLSRSPRAARDEARKLAASRQACVVCGDGWLWDFRSGRTGQAICRNQPDRDGCAVVRPLHEHGPGEIRTPRHRLQHGQFLRQLWQAGLRTPGRRDRGDVARQTGWACGHRIRDRYGRKSNCHIGKLQPARGGDGNSAWPHLRLCDAVIVGCNLLVSAFCIA